MLLRSWALTEKVSGKRSYNLIRCYIASELTKITTGYAYDNIMMGTANNHEER